MLTQKHFRPRFRSGVLDKQTIRISDYRITIYLIIRSSDHLLINSSPEEWCYHPYYDQNHHNNKD